MDKGPENTFLAWQRLEHLFFGQKKSRKIEVYDREGG